MKNYTKEEVEALVLENFWKEVERAEEANYRRENYVSLLEPASVVWLDFDYLPDNLGFDELLMLVEE